MGSGMVKFNPTIPIITLSVIAILLDVFQLALYFIGWSDRWLDSVAVALTIIAFALFLGVRKNEI